MEKVKKEATELFSACRFKLAIEKFSECLELDPLNAQFNSSILFNRAVVYSKLTQNTTALSDLDKAIELKDDYAKAYLKRAEVNLILEHYEEAVRDYEKVQQLDPSI